MIQRKKKQFLLNNEETEELHDILATKATRKKLALELGLCRQSVYKWHKAKQYPKYCSLYLRLHKIKQI